ncbi:MAG TPA: hypothetical protein VG326_01365 [Tepidisphaeraceae bacterium]|jgi:hypothetical protein|nr:hypothetical protein [Tepidisphaeraceae bacterium]
MAGFEKCHPDDDGGLEDNFEKLALFAVNAGGSFEPRHAAIQSPSRNGLWRSKMGEDEDIEHELSTLVGSLYGEVIFYMKRTIEKKRAVTALLKKRGFPSH